MLAEHQDAHIARMPTFRWPRKQLQVVGDLLDVHLGCALIERASNFGEVLAQKPKVEVIDLGKQIGTIVERYVGCRVEQLPFLVGRGDDGAAEPADVIPHIALVFGEHVLRGFVWTPVTARNPDDDDVGALEEHRFDDRVVQRLDAATEPDEPLEGVVDFVLGIPLGGSTGEPSCSSTPTTIYPPPMLSISFANAQMVWMIGLGLKLALNSTRVDSTVRRLMRSSRLTGMDMMPPISAFSETRQLDDMTVEYFRGQAPCFHARPRAHHPVRGAFP